MLTEQKSLEIPLLFKKSMQAYSHLLKDGMFPERILSIVSHSFLKSVKSGNREESICTRLLVAEILHSVQWDEAHVRSIT